MKGYCLLISLVVVAVTFSKISECGSPSPAPYNTSTSSPYINSLSSEPAPPTVKAKRSGKSKKSRKAKPATASEPASSLAPAQYSYQPEQTTVRKSRKQSGCSYNGNPVYVGPRGGCYYINGNGNKTYVDHSYCSGCY